MTQFYNWCFTSYSATSEVDARLRTLVNAKTAKYAVFQGETCPTSGRFHLQGYIEFKTKKTMKAIKELMQDNRLHLEPRKGTQEQAIAYCKKTETRSVGPFEFGIRAQQGHRTDLDAMYDMLEEGATPAEVLHAFRGNAVRHISHIVRTANIIWGNDAITEQILHARAVAHNWYNNHSNQDEASRATRDRQLRPMRILHIEDEERNNS